LVQSSVPFWIISLVRGFSPRKIRERMPTAVSASDFSAGNLSMMSCGRAGPVPRAV
jgi:hypothetical protein